MTEDQNKQHEAANGAAEQGGEANRPRSVADMSPEERKRDGLISWRMDVAIHHAEKLAKIAPALEFLPAELQRPVVLPPMKNLAVAMVQLFDAFPELKESVERMAAEDPNPMPIDKELEKILKSLGL